MSPITLKHISQLSGYSISTVSKALNNGFDISNQTKLKIRKLAASNNYIPNRTALALRNKRTKIIGVIVPNINSTFYSNVLSAIQKKAFDEGYRILVSQSFGIKNRESECINEIKHGCVDGIIVMKSFHKKNTISTGVNSANLSSSIIYIEVKSPMNTYRSKLLGEESLNILLQQFK